MSPSESICHFFRIPVEIRVQIYELVLCQAHSVCINLADNFYQVQTADILNLPKVNQQIYRESSGMAYELNTFCVRAPMLEVSCVKLDSVSKTVDGAKASLSQPAISLESTSTHVRESMIRHRELQQSSSGECAMVGIPQNTDRQMIVSRLQCFVAHPPVARLPRLDIYLGSQMKPGFVHIITKCWDNVSPIIRRLSAHMLVKVSFDARLSRRMLINYVFEVKDPLPTLVEIDACIPSICLTLPEMATHMAIRDLIWGWCLAREGVPKPGFDRSRHNESASLRSAGSLNATGGLS